MRSFLSLIPLYHTILTPHLSLCIHHPISDNGNLIPHLSLPHAHAQTKPRGFLATGALIAARETPLALYKGLGAVLAGIVPKMAIRFAAFERYRAWLADPRTGAASVGGVFLGALFDLIVVCSEQGLTFW